MREPKKVLAFDVGVATSPVGWAFVLVDAPRAYETGSFWAKKDGKKNGAKCWRTLYKEARELFDLYKPDTVLICRPMGRFAGTIYQQAKQVGVIEMLCDYRGVQFIDKPDSTYRATYWGKDCTKKENQKKLGISDDNEADALVAALCAYSLFLNPPKKKNKKVGKSIDKPTPKE